MSQWRNILLKLKRKDIPAKKDSVQLFVEKLSSEDPKLVLRVIQSLFEQKVAESRNAILLGKKGPDIRGLHNVWPFMWREINNETSTIEKVAANEIDMTKQSVLSCPWSYQSHVAALMHHGEGRNRGAWKQDTNHSIVWYKPIEIGFAENGLHSITQGVLAREGTIVPTTTYDISEVLRRYEVQGRYYIRLEDGIRFNANDRIWAAIFTAGRLMVLAKDKESKARANRDTA